MFQDGQDMMNADDHELPMKALTGQIIGMAMKIHNAMGAGYIESVYHRCMEIELTKAGIAFESKKHLPVHYEGQLVGTFEADIVIVVDQQLIIELKATEALLIAHEVQLVNYLTASGIEDGLLLNFGAEKLQFRRKFKTFRPRRIALQPLTESDHL